MASQANCVITIQSDFTVLSGLSHPVYPDPTEKPDLN